MIYCVIIVPTENSPVWMVYFFIVIHICEIVLWCYVPVIKWNICIFLVTQTAKSYNCMGLLGNHDVFLNLVDLHSKSNDLPCFCSYHRCCDMNRNMANHDNCGKLNYLSCVAARGIAVNGLPYGMDILFAMWFESWMFLKWQYNWYDISKALCLS